VHGANRNPRNSMNNNPSVAPLITPNRSAGLDALSSVDLADRCSTEASKHFVQFYESDGYLIQAVGTFIAQALDAEEGALVIATAAHRAAVEEYLSGEGLDMIAAQAGGQCLCLDAAETLSKFMVGGLPDRDLFMKTVGGLVASATRSGRGFRAFGEMVALLWAEGNGDGAIRLEQLWNELANIHSFSLLCAYPMKDFSRAANGETFAHICGEHSQVLPAESYDRVGRTTDERFREIALLQQKARALDTELAERKRLEEIRYSLAAIVESSDDAIVSKDLNSIIQSWNRGAERIFGYTADEVIGKPITILIPPDHIDEEPAIIERIRQGERVEHFETIRRRKDGSRVEISVTISPIKDDRGHVIGASKIARDITQRKRDERALNEAREELVRSRSELESRVRERTIELQETIGELEAFSYSISHDMRAPLRSMQGYATILMQECGEALNPECRAYLQRIKSSGERMDRLIQDVLTFSRVSRSEFSLEPVDLDHLVRGIAEAYPNLQPPDAQIIIEDRLPWVRGNTAGLTQCISNLLGNAAKFVAPGTRPHIRVWAESRSSAAGEAPMVRLFIQDNGIGIPKQLQDKIFVMFQRVSKKYEGTGIGLAIVKKAAERMSGRVGVHSEAGHGSTFWLELQQAELPFA
jgi:PAS domain S-box-containing protein